MEAPMQFFPHDIIEQILLKLPTKSLLRFKCVCKSWRDLISTHKFAINHLTETSEKFRRVGVIENTSQCIFLCSPAAQGASRAEQAKQEAIFLPPMGEDCYLIPAANRFDSTRIWPYCTDRITDAMVSGSCNGMLLIQLEIAERSKRFSRTFLLWNPTIREFKMIPGCYFIGSFRYLVSGLGYNSSIDDYNVVVVFSEKKSDSVCGYIYNLKTNSWKQLENLNDAIFLDYFPDETGKTLVNGAPHWAMLSLNSRGVNKIIYFDLVEEKFKEFLSPPPSTGTIMTSLSIYEGCLCENRLRKIENYTEYTLEIWMMKEYGEKESWIKLMNLSVAPTSWYVNDMMPLVASKNSDEVVIVTCWNNMISFNPITGEVKDTLFYQEKMKEVLLFGTPDDWVASYKESLVSPNRFSMAC